MSRTSAGPVVTVTSRVLAILGSFDDEHRSLSLTEVARRAGQTLPTAHRLVGELAEWGALRRTSSGNFVIGRRLWDLGLLAPVQTGLRDVAAPFLQDLYGATTATVHLAVRDHPRLVSCTNCVRKLVATAEQVPDRAHSLLQEEPCGFAVGTVRPR